MSGEELHREREKRWKWNVEFNSIKMETLTSFQTIGMGISSISLMSPFHHIVFKQPNHTLLI